ncbi:hypothetical protein [Chitinophaga caseinilytica]|uniref:Entry exclusion lipoprotein TrbK n=1 Tax=Chitinophaga caseinilytica TaxID=2267521 RepID=A0ABZ2Z9N7_9BACT
MRHLVICLIVISALGAGCRSQKTGCPTPKRNLGAEKVFDEMNAPKKKGLFRRR